MHVRPPTSDEILDILQGIDFLHGNVLLSGWYLTIDNFCLTELPSYILWLAVFGKNSLACYFVIPSIEYLFIVILALFLSMRSINLNYRNILALSFIFLLIGTPPDNSPAFIAVCHIMDISFSLFSLALLTIITKKSFKNCRFIAFSFFVISSMNVFSDPMVISYNYAPIILALGLEVFIGDDWKASLQALILVIFSVLSGLLMQHGTKLLGGFTVIPNGNSVVTDANVIPSSLIATIFGFLYISSSYIFGKSIVSFSSMRLAVWIGGLVFNSKNQKIFHKTKTRDSFLNNCLLISFVFTLLACFLSGNFSNVINNLAFTGGAANRYLLPSVIYGAILLARTSGDFAYKLPTNRFRVVFILVLFFAAAASLAAHVKATVNMFRSPSSITNSPAVSVSKWLLEQNLTCGIGEYWSASIISVLSHGQVIVRAVIPAADGSVQPYLWVSKDEWYKGKTSPGFYIEQSGMSTPNLIETYGQPKEVENIDGYKIFVFSEKSKGAGMKLQCKLD